jgi:2-hydroxychromene-2-carboxylate isomerase
MMARPTIDYFYSVRSSFTYLGAARLNAIAAGNKLTITHRPMDLLAVVTANDEVDRQQPTDRAFAGARVFERSPLREAYTRLEYRRWSEHLGIPINVDPSHHYGARELPSGAVIVAQRLGLDADGLSHAILQALWRDDRDIADPDVIMAIVAETGLEVDRRTLVRDAMARDAQDELAANTRLAMARGVFGSPTYIFEEELFFGQDRLDFLERAIARRRGELKPAV